MTFDSGILGLLEVLVMLAIVLFASRQAMLWYWKVNQQLALLTEIRDALRALTVVAASTSPEPLGGTTPRTSTTTGSGPVVSAPRWEPALTPWEERASKGSSRE